MLPATHVSISIARDWRDLYEAIWEPLIFPKWAEGMSNSELTHEGDHWSAKGPNGAVKIRFTPHNDFGVMDHEVDVGAAKIFMPMRVVANGDGAEVILTVYRQPEMTDQVYAEDLAAVTKDLTTLKRLFSA